jgi:hypothetical protein
MSKLIRFAIAALFFSPVLISCGASNALKDGYYLTDGDTSKASYPLVIVKVTGSTTAVYQVSQVDSGGFGAGSNANTGSVSDLTTVVQLDGNDDAYMGFLTQKGESLRVRALKVPKNTDISDERDLAKADILSDSLLPPVSKADAITALKKLVTVRGTGTTYSGYDEKACQGAFAMSCTDLFK